MTRYREIVREDFEAAMASIGFTEVFVSGNEHAYQRVIHNGPTPNRFAVRVFSSILKGAGISRDSGADAIRVHVIDLELLDRTGRPKIVADFARVYRTQNALTTVVERCREAYGYVCKSQDHHCPSCRALMTERKSKSGSFLGCTAYPVCRTTRNLTAMAA